MCIYTSTDKKNIVGTISSENKDKGFISDVLILGLACLKEIGIKGFGYQKRFEIINNVKRRGLNICTIEELYDLLRSLNNKIFKEITLIQLQEANKLANKILQKSADRKIFLLGFCNPKYPEILKNTINEKSKPEPPSHFWYRGNISILEKKSIAIIGSRYPLEESVKACNYITKEFAKRDFNIVSGLAIGCDTVAHRAALDVSGNTIAILSNGLDNESIYPSENVTLSMQIVDNGGLLISEYPIDKKVSFYDLVNRDKLQAGLSISTVLIQSKSDGGSMHAAKCTLNASKPLFCVSYKDNLINKNYLFSGNKKLLEEGAIELKGSDNFDDLKTFLIKKSYQK